MFGYQGVFGTHIPVLFAGDEADMDAVYMYGDLF
jgi:hypothetical protein